MVQMGTSFSEMVRAYGQGTRGQNIYYKGERSYADPEGGRGVRTPSSLKNHNIIRFLSNTGQDPQKKSQNYQDSIHVWPKSARQRNAI